MKVRFGEFTLDGESRQLLKGDRDVHLSPKGLDLLAALLVARPRALSKDELHTLLWPQTFVSDANLAMIAAEVRGAIDDDARMPRFVRTVQRYGYAFHGEAIDESSAGRSKAAGRLSQYWLIAPFRQIPLIAGENLVGRDPSLQVWIDSAGVSRRHARIIVDRDQVTLEDLNSKNGTRVRGQLLAATVPLAEGDEIHFGSVVVTFRTWSGDEATVSEARQQ